MPIYTKLQWPGLWVSKTFIHLLASCVHGLPGCFIYPLYKDIMMLVQWYFLIGFFCYDSSKTFAYKYIECELICSCLAKLVSKFSMYGVSTNRIRSEPTSEISSGNWVKISGQDIALTRIILYTLGGNRAHIRLFQTRARMLHIWVKYDDYSWRNKFWYLSYLPYPQLQNVSTNTIEKLEKERGMPLRIVRYSDKNSKKLHETVSKWNGINWDKNDKKKK